MLALYLNLFFVANSKHQYLQKKKKSKIKPVGFIVGTKNIYLTTDNGLLILIDIY